MITDLDHPATVLMKRCTKFAPVMAAMRADYFRHGKTATRARQIL